MLEQLRKHYGVGKGGLNNAEHKMSASAPPQQPRSADHIIMMLSQSN